MWKVVFRHEWRRLFTEKSAWLALGALLALGLFGALNGLRWTSFQRAAIRDFQKTAAERLAAYRESVLELERKNAPDAEFDARRPLIAGAFRVFQPAALPPAPFSAFAIGDRDLRPYLLRVTTREAMPQTEIANPLNAATGWLDIAFVVTFLLPLLILALSYDALAGEREQGTLALALSQPIAASALLFGKLAARAALLIGGVWLTGALAFALTEVPIPEALLRLAAWMAAVGAYTLLWLAVAAAVAAQGWSAATSAVALAVIWLAWGVLAPAAAAGIADFVAPGPPTTELVNAERTAERDAEARAQELAARYLAEQATPTPLKPDDFSIQSLARRAALDAALRPLREADAQARRRRHELRRQLAWLAPTLLMQQGLDALSGADDDRWLSFREQVAAFQRAWRAGFAERALRNELIRSDEIATWTPFAMQERPLGVVLGRLGLACGLWLGLSAALFGLAARRLADGAALLL